MPNLCLRKLPVTKLADYENVDGTHEATMPYLIQIIQNPKIQSSGRSYILGEGDTQINKKVTINYLCGFIVGMYSV